METSSWHLQVLGQVRLSGPGHPAAALERKLAAAFAYLALEGGVPRTRLVGLLWPDSPEATARNNLSQLLRRLRLTTGAELITGTEELSLDPGLRVDAAQVRDALTQGRFSELLQLTGTLLQALSYDDCPDLDEWLTAQREHFQEWRVQALRTELLRAEDAGDYELALSHARQLLGLDPVSEAAHRHLMRLLYLHGDRPAALRAYRRCQEVLRREFGVEALPETVRLAREIALGTVPVPAPARAVALPLAAQRPPHLVGREREWGQLEAAWPWARYIFVRGAPGSGKTRLARDFAASRGEYIVYEGRPGDAGVPFASSARIARTVLHHFPGVPLQEWVRREMARVLPELAHPGEVLPPLNSEADVLRLRQAKQVFHFERTGHLAAILGDDWQFFDPETSQSGMFMWNSPLPHGVTGRFPPMIITYRRDEVTPDSEAMMSRLIESGLGAVIDVGPLADDAMDALMTDLGVPDTPLTRQRLLAHSGGNPLFLLETVKLLLETGRLSSSLPERLPLPPRVGQLIERRLALLSTPALQAARAAALLQRDFDVELVAQTLGAPLFDLLPAWEELETAQIVQGERFSHDLVYEAVSQGIPASVRPLLHRGAARALEGQRAHPIRIAQHWLEGGKPDLAAPLWLRAAEHARAQYLHAAAAQSLGQAADAYWAAGEADAAFTAWNQQGEALFYLEDRDAVATLSEALEARAKTPRQKAISHRIVSARLWSRGEVAGARAAAQSGLACAVQAGDLGLEAGVLELLVVIGTNHHLQDDLEPALQHLLSTAVTQHDVPVQALAHDLLALSLGGFQPEVGRRHAEVGETLYRSLDHSTGAVGCAQKVTALSLRLGDLNAARAGLARAADYLSHGETSATQHLFHLHYQAECDLAQGRYSRALEALEQTRQLDVMHGAVWTPEVQALRATVLAELGAQQEALAEARPLLRALPDSPNQRPEPRIHLLGILSGSGQAAEVQIALAEAARTVAGLPYWEARFDLAHAQHLALTERLPRLDAVLRRSREQGWRGLALAAEVRRNAARLELGLPPLPWEADAEDHPAGTIGLLEWRTVQAQVAAAQDPQGASQAASGLRDGLERMAQHDVPPEYLEPFRQRAQVLLGSVEKQADSESLPMR